MKLYLRTALAVFVFTLCAHKESAAQSGCNSGGTGCTTPAPEIDPSFAASEAILLGGVILMVRGRARR